MMVRRKGQAAMEFLMTYGWAILVVLAAIGALAYFGVLSPDRFLPDKCTASPPFACTEYKVSEAGSIVNLTLQNSAGTGMTIYSVDIKCTTSGTALTNTSSGGNGAVLNGDEVWVAFDTGAAGWGTAGGENGCAPLSEGDRFKGTYVVTYQKEGEGTTHTGSGSIQVRVEA